MYNKFKEALLKATTKEHREEIMKKQWTGTDLDSSVNDYNIHSLRDITLEDVLRALINKKPMEKITNEEDIRYGEMADATDGYIYYILDLWQLGKPAHEQSNETLEAIYNLIK